MNFDSAAEQWLPPILANDVAAFRRQRAFRRLGSAILVLTVTAVGTAAMAVEDPIAPLVAVSTSFIDVAASISNQTPLRTAAAAPSTRSVDSEGLPRLAMAAEPTPSMQAETATAAPGALLNQFVAWADDRQAQERIVAQAPQQPTSEPAQPAVAAQDLPEPVMAEASPASGPAPTPQVATARLLNARAELPPARPDRALTAHAPHASPKPVEKAQAEVAPAQQPRSLLQLLGLRG